MLRDEIIKYTELTGEDGNRTPIMKIGAYLDGYEKGLSVLDKIRTEMEALANHRIRPISFDQAVAVDICINIIDKYMERRDKE